MGEPTFDIFSGTTDKDAMWMEAVEGLASARERMEEIASSAPGRYFIFAQRSRAILARIDTRERPESLRKDRESGAA
jgi:hypothetical protein